MNIKADDERQLPNHAAHDAEINNFAWAAISIRWCVEQLPWYREPEASHYRKSCTAVIL